MASSRTQDSREHGPSAWSEYVWDEGGFWVSSRRGPTGALEYTYDYPESPGQTEGEQATPRTPVEDYITQATTLNAASFQDHTGQIYPSRSSLNLYTTSNSTQIALRESSERPAYPQSRPLLSANSSYNSIPLPGEQGWNINGQGNSNGSTNQSYYGADITQGMQSLSISTPNSNGGYDYPQLPADQLNASRHIRRTNSAVCEVLDDRYRVVEEKNLQKFWKKGRVFIMLWTEPAGSPAPKEGGTTRNGSHFSTTYLNGTAYTEIRRFVVIGEGYGNSICSPIHTYSGQATLKSNLPDAQQHAIIHTSKHAPEEKWVETEDEIIRENLIKDPIRVVREQKDDEGDLGNLSRVNYAKIYTVENYVRVLNIGKVHPDSMSSLERNSMFNRPSDEPPQPPRSHKSKSESKRGDSSKKKGSKKHGSGR